MAHGKFPLKSVLIEKCPATPLYFILKSPLAFDWKHIFIIVSLANRKVIYFQFDFWAEYCVVNANENQPRCSITVKSDARMPFSS